ncbi:MAG: LysM peptidoglycan-binding domain-containing protein [Propionibacteriaceae bacterium]|jgi:nucleoid-associated protein YgaU|nr:LysM peptidoglycan-binding domain-containing protein [Propionibacteriaceae bacterium]
MVFNELAATKHVASRRRPWTAIGAGLVLTLILIGPPLLLARFGDWPLLGLLLRDPQRWLWPDDGHYLSALLAAVGALAWLLVAVSIILELIDALRLRRDLHRQRRWPSGGNDQLLDARQRAESFGVGSSGFRSFGLRRLIRPLVMAVLTINLTSGAMAAATPVEALPIVASADPSGVVGSSSRLGVPDVLLLPIESADQSDQSPAGGDHVNQSSAATSPTAAASTDGGVNLGLASGDDPTNSTVSSAASGTAEQSTGSAPGVPTPASSGVATDTEPLGPVAGGTTLPDPTSSGEADLVRAYTVTPGDSLWSIAEQVWGDGSAWELLVEANLDRYPLTDGRLEAGWTIAIPPVTDAALPSVETAEAVAPAAPSSDSDSRSSLDPAAAVTDDPTAVSDPVGTTTTANPQSAEYSTAADPAADSPTKSVTVEPGDTLWSIAASALGDGHRWPELVTANDSLIDDPDLIEPGWQLDIPDSELAPPSSALTASPTQQAPTPTSQAPQTQANTNSPGDSADDSTDASSSSRVSSGGASTISDSPSPVTPSDSLAGHGHRSPSSRPTAAEPSASDLPTVPRLSIPDDGDRVMVIATAIGVSSLLAAGLVLRLRRRRSLQLNQRPIGRRIAPAPVQLQGWQSALIAAGEPKIDIHQQSMLNHTSMMDEQQYMHRGVRMAAGSVVPASDPLANAPASEHQMRASGVSVCVGTRDDDQAAMVLLPTDAPFLVAARRGETAALVTRGLAMQLALDPVDPTTDLRVVKTDDLFDSFDTVTCFTSAAEALDDVVEQLSTRHQQLGGQSWEWYRHDPDLSEAWRPIVYCFVEPIDSQQCQQITACLSGPNVGVYVIATIEDVDLPQSGSRPQDRASLHVDQFDRAVIQPEGLVVQPLRLKPTRALSHLLLSVESSATIPAWWDSEAGSLPSKAVPSPAGGDSPNAGPTAGGSSARTDDDTTPVDATLPRSPISGDNNIATTMTAASAEDPNVDGGTKNTSTMEDMPVGLAQPGGTTDRSSWMEAGSVELPVTMPLEAQSKPVLATPDMTSATPSSVSNSELGPASAATQLTPRLTVISPLTPTPPEARPDPSPVTALGPVVAPDPVQSQPMVLLLGSVTIEGARGSAPERSQRACIECASYLLEHPGSSPTAMSAGLLIAETTRRSNISRLRKWLGNDDSDRPFLPEAYTGKISLSPQVSSDWQQMRRLLAAGLTKASTEDMRAALQLVRGRPLADAAPGQWHWAEELRIDMACLIRDLGVTLTLRLIEDADIEGARWAAGRALKAVPQDERLICARVQTEYAAGNRFELERLTAWLIHNAETLGVDLLPETVDVLQAINQRAEGLPMP